MVVNILGTKYSVFTSNDSEEPRLTGYTGFCDDTVKEICLQDFTALTSDPHDKKDLKSMSNKVLRHEIVHAFLFESGLTENSDWAQNEELVDWIAIQGPKIYKAWQEANAV